MKIIYNKYLVFALSALAILSSYVMIVDPFTIDIWLLSLILSPLSLVLSLSLWIIKIKNFKLSTVVLIVSLIFLLTDIIAISVWGSSDLGMFGALLPLVVGTVTILTLITLIGITLLYKLVKLLINKFKERNAI